MTSNPYTECKAGCCRTGRRDTCYRKLRCRCGEVVAIDDLDLPDNTGKETD